MYVSTAGDDIAMEGKGLLYFPRDGHVTAVSCILDTRTLCIKLHHISIPSGPMMETPAASFALLMLFQFTVPCIYIAPQLTC